MKNLNLVRIFMLKVTRHFIPGGPLRPGVSAVKLLNAAAL
jgi:hypothetical protein